MTGWEAALLGIVQGLTEFLPVSSSGHLVLAKAVFGVEGSGIVFDIFVHFGTLMAIVTVFRSDLWDILKELPRVFRGQVRQDKNSDSGEDSTNKRMLIFLVVGTIPAAFLGYLYKDVFERFFTDPVFVCGALIITGVMLLVTKFKTESNQDLSFGRSFWIGLAQVVAFFPGISRSGTTISAGLFLGLKPMESVRFSFLLAVPLILGVTILQVFELIAGPPSADEIFLLIVGSVFAYFSGLLAIRWLLRIVRTRRIDRFGYYCIGVGLLGLLAFRLEFL